MNALAEKVTGFLRWATMQDKPLPEPEKLKTTARPMKGFWDGLSAEQKKRVLSYTGREDHGDPAFRRT